LYNFAPKVKFKINQ